MPTTEERESAMAEKLLNNAYKMLDLIDDAFIVKERGHTPRKMPKFRPEEVSLGKVLGVGGFGVVNEITNITLDLSPQASFAEDDNRPKNDNGTTGISKTEEAKETDQKEGDEPSGDQATTPAANDERAEVRENGDEKNHLKVKLPDDLRSSNFSVRSAGTTASVDTSCHDNQIHYEISKARHVMSRRAVRNGVSRYAIKRLHCSDLNELEKARGMVDLAMEAKYLSVVWHPNISKFLTRKFSEVA